MKTAIPLIAGGIVALCSLLLFIPLFLSDRERPTRANLSHPMPRWLLVLCAIWAAFFAGGVVASIVDNWIR